MPGLVSGDTNGPVTALAGGPPRSSPVGAIATRNYLTFDRESA